MREADYFIDDLVYRSVRVQSRSAGVLRPGQCLFNTLCGLRRDLAHKVAGTNVNRHCKPNRTSQWSFLTTVGSTKFPNVSRSIP